MWIVDKMSLIIPRVLSKAYSVMFTVFTCSFARNPSNLCSEGASEDPLGSRGALSPLDSFLRHSRSIGTTPQPRGSTTHFSPHHTHRNTAQQSQTTLELNTNPKKKEILTPREPCFGENCNSAKFALTTQLPTLQTPTSRTRRKRSLPELVTFQIRPPN